MSVWRAAAEGNAKQLSDLLRKSRQQGAGGGYAINATNALGQTLLHIAVIANQPESVSLLLADPNIDINRKDSELGWTPLHHAIFKKFTKLAIMLAARGSEIDVLDHMGFSPVDLAFADSYPPPSPATPERLNHHSDRFFSADEPLQKRPREQEAFGELFTWGEGSNYCLGHGNPNSVSQPKRLTSLQEDDITQVSTSDFATGVVTRSGRLYTFGVGTGGRLGHGDNEVRLVPKRIVGPLLQKRAVWVSMGHAHSAAVMDDGSVFTWGCGEFGQLGHGSTEDSSSPRKIRSGFEGQKPIAVAAGRHHTVVLTSRGCVWSFGCGQHGELGYLTDAQAKKAYCHCTPRQVVCIEAPVVAVAVGKAHTACATQGGDVYLLGFGSPQARKLPLPAVMPSAFAARQQHMDASLSSYYSSSSQQQQQQQQREVLPTPVYSISPAQTAFSVLSDDGATTPHHRHPLGPSSHLRGIRAITSLVASGDMTLAVFNRRDVFLSDLYHHHQHQHQQQHQHPGDGLHSSRLPKPVSIPALPGNHTIASASLSTAKEILVATDAGHLWKCAESRQDHQQQQHHHHHKSKQASTAWTWSRISVAKRFSRVACSRNHYAAIAQKETGPKQSIAIRPWSLSAHLLEELEKEDFADVEFVLDDGRRVPAHKIVLAMRGKYFASLFGDEDEDEGPASVEEGSAPVWGEGDWYAPGLAAASTRNMRREVMVDQVAFPVLHNFIRLVYTDLAGDPTAVVPHRQSKLTQGEKAQAAALLQRFGMRSIASKPSSSRGDTNIAAPSTATTSSKSKSKGKGKERVGKGKEEEEEEDQGGDSAYASAADPPQRASSSSAHAPVVMQLSRFERELRQAFFDERLTDVDLVSCEEERIPCHKVIICSQSEVLRAMMTSGMLESQKSQIFIQNASTDTLQKVKEFLYLGNFAELEEKHKPTAKQGGGTATTTTTTTTTTGGGRGEAIPFSTVMELLNISNQFMLGRMKETLEDLLLRQYLDYDNLVSLLITAENYSCLNLKRQLFAFAQRNFISLLMAGNVSLLGDLLPGQQHQDYAYLLDHLDYFLQSSGRLPEDEQHQHQQDRDADDEQEEEEEEEEAQADDLLEYLSEEEIQRQKEMEAFWEQERQIEKERENQKANEQRRRAAKARAKAAKAAKARGRPTTTTTTTTNPQGPHKDKEGDMGEEAEAGGTASAKDTTTPAAAAAKMTTEGAVRASVEAANRALAQDYSGEGNEEAIRVVKRLRAAKKKLGQIDALKDRQAKGDDLDHAQRAKLDQESALEDEIAALLLQLSEQQQAAQLPPAPVPSGSTTGAVPVPVPVAAAPVASAEPLPATPTGPVAYKKKRDNDDFFSGHNKAVANRNRRRTNSGKQQQSSTPTPSLTPALAQPPAPQSQGPPQPAAPPLAPSLAPWAAVKTKTATDSKPALTALGSAAAMPGGTAAVASVSGSSPQRALSLLQIQEEQLRLQKGRRDASAGRGKQEQQQQQQRKVKRLNGAVEKEAKIVAAPRSLPAQVGSADNDSAKYSLSLAIGGKSAASPVRVTTPFGSAAAAAASPPRPSPPRSTTDGHRHPPAGDSFVKLPAVAATSPSRPIPTPAPEQQPRRPPPVLFPTSPQRAPSLADIQRQERERIEAERKRREVVKPTKKSLKEIQDEQEEIRKVQALFGDELKQIYGKDVDLESIW